MMNRNELPEELLLSDAQLDRVDEIYDAVFTLCQILTEDEDLEWDMEFIGEIADFATSSLVKHGHKIRFPAIVSSENGEDYVEDYVQPETPLFV